MHVLYCIIQCMKIKTPRSQFCTCISVSNKTYIYVTLDNFSYRFLFLYFTKKTKTKNTLGPTFTYMCYPGPFFNFAPILPLYRCCFLLPWVLEVLLLSREGKVSHDTNSLQSSCIKCTRSKFPAEALKDITQIN